MSIATFFIIINAILAASIPVFVFHIGATNSGTGMMLFDYGTSFTASIIYVFELTPVMQP